MGRTMFHTLEGPVNTISVNKDVSQIVVAGRNVFKVFSIEEDEFVERANFRVGKNINLNFNVSDVVWNPVEENIIASGATNGAVVVWNINRTQRSKQDHVFLEHRRTVNRICFHPLESHFLLSGSQDGYMKLFDLRKKEVNLTFSGLSESVRDVQFSPHFFFSFAAAFDNGNVQIWDLRRPDRFERQFTAHNGPVFAVDWHPDPEEKYWLGTAGRDRMIKVWDTTFKPKCTNMVQSIASVSRIKWRPQRKYHIASCALMTDYSINVWDIRRPYIPFAQFNQHKNVTTSIIWKHDPHVFLSASKDCTIYQHMFRDAVRPADHANPIGIDINIYGRLSHASSDKLLGVSGSKSIASNHSQTKLPSFFKKIPDRSEMFTVVSSSLFLFDNLDKSLSMDWFISSAKRYVLIGRSFDELCDHNASVARSLDRASVAQCWMMLKLLYTRNTTTPSQVRAMTITTPGGGNTDTERGVKQNLDSSHLQENHHPTSEQETRDKHTGDTSTVISDDESDSESENELNLANIASGLAGQTPDFFFGDGEVDTTPFEFDNLTNIENGQDWNLPSEAFQPRHEIERNEVPDSHVNHHATTAAETPPSGSDSELSLPSNLSHVADRNKEELSLQTIPFISQIPTWQFNNLVIDLLYQYAEQGDVQMSVSILIVLGDRLKLSESQIPDATLEQWYLSYVDLLSRFELWTIATEVISLAHVTSVNQVNQQSTTYRTNCNRCSKILMKSGWTCQNCKQLTNTCSICHHPVKGLYVWCQGCGHGGHLTHIKDWLKRSPYCPTGCGHLCEYT
ncbi:GATOR2 complex protein WDR24-like isoform X2 [Tubulanus polymorphus]